MWFFNKNKYDDMNEKELEVEYRKKGHNLDVTEKIIKSYLKRQPNYHFLKNHEDFYVFEILSSIKDGYTLSNDFLVFITKIKHDKFIPLDLINRFFKLGHINSSNDFIYHESLYNESNADNVYKLKAVVYAYNPHLQINAEPKIGLVHLMNDDNSFKTAKEMKEILDTIKEVKE